MSSGLTEKQLHAVYQIKGSPWYWRQKAEELKCAAELVFPHSEEGMTQILEMIKTDSVDITKFIPNTFSIFLALTGFSTEALLKGLIIKKHTAYLSNRKMAGLLKTHDLIELASHAAYPLTQDEKIYCKQAYHSIKVDFRYPIPVDGNDERNSMEVGRHCKVVFEELYNKIHPQLNFMIFKGGKIGEVNF